MDTINSVTGVDPFEADTAADSVGNGRYRVRFPGRWSTGFAVSGGFVAAVMARAMHAEVADETRTMRSLTCHFLSAPAADSDGVVDVVIERTGRGLTSVTARVSSGERPLALGMAAFARQYANEVAYDEASRTLPPPPPGLDPPPKGVLSPPFLHNYRMTPTVGAVPFSETGPAYTGGWIEFLAPAPLDAVRLVALSDAWWPTPFSHLRTRMPSPTIDLTVHVRTRLPFPSGPVFSEFRSTLLRDAHFEEDGAIRSPQGELLAHSRQLALLLPAPPEASREAPPVLRGLAVQGRG